MTNLYKFADFLVDPVERRLLRGGAIVPLNPKSFDTLLLLVENSGRALERGSLIDALWPDTFVEENNLSDHISRVRQALGGQPQSAAIHRDGPQARLLLCGAGRGRTGGVREPPAD